MKYLKMLGLAAVAAAALLAVVGAGTASATTLCTENAACPTGHTTEGGKMWQPKDIIKGTSTEARLTNPLGDVVCTHSEVELELTTTGGVVEGKTTSPEGHVKNLTFTGCTRAGNPCTVTVVNLPYKASVTVGTEPNGTLDVVSGGKGNPGATVVCGVFINCTFSQTTFGLPVTGGNPATVTAANVVLLRSGGICPSEAKWDATYKTTAATGGVFVK